MEKYFCKLLLINSLLFCTTFFAQKDKNEKLISGEIFSCYFEKQEDRSINNYLKIKASKRTEVVVKLIDKKTDKCVRYAFINQKDEYDMKGIPEGIYYVKVGYGKGWAFSDTSKCYGEFKETSGYKKLHRVLNYEFKGTKKNPQIPSYELDLDVKYGSEDDGELITQKEFHK